MAFPQVAAVNGGNNTSASTDHTVNLPVGIEAGDLLLVFFTSDGLPTITFPEGWTKLREGTDDSSVTFACWYRIADGEEGATINVTTSASEQSAHTSYRITGYSETPEASAFNEGSSIYPSPISLTPSWGALDTLWFACEGNDDRDTVVTYPTNYTDGRNDYANAVGGCGVGSARRELNAESEDPGVFTLSDSEGWVAFTVAIKPEEIEPPAAVVPWNLAPRMAMMIGSH